MAGLTILLAAMLAHAGETTSVTVQLQLLSFPAGAQPVALTTWLGEDRTMQLVDDGSITMDKAGDGVFVGRWTGDDVRVLPVRLGLRSSTGTVTTLGAFNEVVGAGENDFAYAVSSETPPTVRRVAAAWSSRSAEAADLARVGAAIGWAGLVLGYVAWLVGRSPGSR